MTRKQDKFTVYNIDIISQLNLKLFALLLNNGLKVISYQPWC